MSRPAKHSRTSRPPHGPTPEAGRAGSVDDSREGPLPALPSTYGGCSTAATPRALAYARLPAHASPEDGEELPAVDPRPDDGSHRQAARLHVNDPNGTSSGAQR